MKSNKSEHIPETKRRKAPWEDDEILRLCLQIGDKGRAVITASPKTTKQQNKGVYQWPH